MKKILFYINTLEHGGAERVLSNLANQFCEEGNDVIFVTSYKEQIEYVLNSGIIRINLENSNKNDNFFQRNIGRVLKLRKIIKKHNPDIVVSFLPEANFRAILATIGTKTPTLISVRNDPNKEYASKNNYLFQKWLYPLATGVVFQTYDAKKWFPNKIQNKSEIIMNQVGSTFFDAQKDEEKYYCAIGRLVEQKNISLLIRAFADFCSDYPEEMLRIYGTGNQYDELHRLIKELNAENNIFLMGNSDDIPGVLSKAKAYILSSEYEGIPNTLLEAMAVGVPVISTDCPCGGPKMLIEHMNNGLLVKVGDKEGIKNSLKMIQENDELRYNLGSCAKRTADKLRPENIFNEWNRFVDKCIGKNISRG